MPPPRWRLARLFSIQGWRFSSQSSMAIISLPVTGPRSSTAPRLVDAVSGDSARAVASLEAGSTTRATMAATARSRMRSGLRPRMRTRPIRRRVPRTAATWPWGRDRRMVKISSGRATVTPPSNRALIPWMMWGGSCVRLARVFFLRRPFSRHAFLMRIVGLLWRFGMASRWKDMEPGYLVCSGYTGTRWDPLSNYM